MAATWVYRFGSNYYWMSFLDWIWWPQTSIFTFPLFLTQHEFSWFGPLNKWEFLKGFIKSESRHSMGKFATKTITSRQHPYPELQSKAWNVTRMQCVFSFLVFAPSNFMGLGMQSPTKDEIVQYPSMTTPGKSLCGMDGRFLGQPLRRRTIPRPLCDEGLLVPRLTMGWHWRLYPIITLSHYLYYLIFIITNDGPHGRKCWEDVVPVSWTPSPVHPPWAIEKVPQVVRALFNSLCAISCRTTVAHWCPESLPMPATGQGRTMTHTCWPFTPGVGAVTFQESMPLAIDIASW